jgi:8-oxo-dGTP diphosphatase
MNETPTVVAVAVVQHDGKFLVGVRSANRPLPGFAEFPGGKVDSGELPEAAAIRECFEESGLQVEIVRELYATRHRYDHGLLEIYFYLCQPQGSVMPSPIPPFRWVDARELQTLNFPAANKPVTALLFSEENASPPA